MKKSILVILLLWTSLLAAQNTKFSISGKLNYSSDKTNTYTEQSTSFWVTPIDEGSSLKTFFATESNLTEVYKIKLGYELIGDFRINLRPRLNLKIGLGLNYTSFNVARISNQLSYTETSTEVIKAPPVFQSSCDVYTNSVNDVMNVRKGTFFHILSLKVPLEIEYEVIPSKLNVGLGLFAQTPLFSTVSYDYRDIHFEENENGENVCEFLKGTIRDKSGRSLNKLQLGLLWNMTYKLTDNIAAQLGMTREFNNVFVDHPPNQHRAMPYELNPLKIHIGIEYGF